MSGPKKKRPSRKEGAPRAGIKAEEKGPQKVVPIGRRVQVRDVATGKIHAVVEQARCTLLPPECDPTEHPVTVRVQARGWAYLRYHTVRGAVAEAWVPTFPVGSLALEELALIEPDGWDHPAWWAGERVRARSTRPGARVRIPIPK